MTRAIVVCPVLPHPPVSGGQKRTLRLLEAAERAGAKPHLLTADLGDAEPLRARGWTVEQIAEPAPRLRERVAQHTAPRPSPYLHGVARRLEALQAGGAAWVQFEHTQSAYYPVAPWIPGVLSLHNLDSQLFARAAARERTGSAEWLRMRQRARATRAVEGIALWRAHTVICVSPEDARAVSHGRARVVLAPNGVDAEFYDVAGEGGEQVVFFGHLGYAPNRDGLQRFLAEGWPELRRRRPEATLAVAGAGPQEWLQGREGVRALGIVDDLPALLGASRALVVPLWVGGGTRLKALEGLAAARPVVSTAIGVEGIGFRPGEHGLVAEHPRGLADLLAELLADPAEARRLGAAGRELAEGFRWPRALAGLERTYAEWVLAAHKFERGLPMTP